MKLKNPDLRTSFTLIRSKSVYHVNELEVYCWFDNERGKVYYFLRGYSDNFYPVSLQMCFSTLEEAFSMADRICSEYPFLGDVISFDDYEYFPEFDNEKFVHE